MDLIEQLFTKRERKPAEVLTPGVGNGRLYIAELSPNDRDLCEMQWLAYQKQSGNDGESKVGFRAFLVCWTLCDETNQRLLDSGNDETELPIKFCEFVDALANGETMIPLRFVSKLYDTAVNKIGLTPDDLEELEGNSETAPDGGANGSKQPPKAKRGGNG